MSALLDIPVAILAGGLATRLRPITEKIPKSLLPVAGKPFLAHQLELLHSQGIRNVVLCVGYLGERVETEFGDGHNWGLKIEYSFDGPVLLGTGGAIKKALPQLGDRFFVLYGDSYLSVDYSNVARAFLNSGKPALMTAFKNDSKWDTSNVWFEDGEIRRYDKALITPEMRYIDYGLGILSGQVLNGRMPGENFDLADIYKQLAATNQLAGYEVIERFYEIGSPEGLLELEALLRH